MEVQLIVTVNVDAGALELDARRRKRPLEQSVTELVGDLECRLHDSVRFRDGVERVGIVLLKTPDTVSA